MAVFLYVQSLCTSWLSRPGARDPRRIWEHWRGAKLLLRGFEPRGPPPAAQAYEISNLAKDFKISREISRFHERFPDFRRDFQISGEISRFPEGFLDFRRDF